MGREGLIDPHHADEPLAEFAINPEAVGSVVALERCEVMVLRFPDVVQFKNSLEHSAEETRGWVSALSKKRLLPALLLSRHF